MRRLGWKQFHPKATLWRHDTNTHLKIREPFISHVHRRFYSRRYRTKSSFVMYGVIGFQNVNSQVDSSIGTSFTLPAFLASLNLAWSSLTSRPSVSHIVKNCGLLGRAVL